MERTKKLGLLSCSICSVSYKKSLNNLTSEVDVYREWTDQVDKMIKSRRSGKARGKLGFISADEDEDSDEQA